ncbi:MAG TPA: hypothetical protein VMC84_07490 [Methanocella sp.]|uniref:hypothetical protein n=1 Tax=Methanocella sp. TaxID=2052833 RepID=UPI002C5DAAEB|nr:hypothetical protein [Methanocella sp.]HTY91002.1 hypothetical protein [Methanocella sp.]
MLKNGALTILAFVFILWAANISYGYIHEAGHALVVKSLGGQVYEIYVNPLGTDAYTLHSYVSGIIGSVSVEMAGLVVTTLLAFFALISDYAPLPVFVALRTAIYALNYAPGTDIYEVHQLLGNASLLISAILVFLNLACAIIAVRAKIKNVSLRKPVLERLLHL